MESDEHWILVVDDDSDIRELACEIIQEEHRCATRAASNGREALDALGESATTPCLILLDENMPVMTGLQFLAVFEKDEAYSGIPVVMISANPCMGLRTSGGALHKPFTADDLHRLVRAHICSFGVSAMGCSVLSRLATMIARDKELIIGQWTCRVRDDIRIPQARDLDELALRNNIPDIVDELIASLTQTAKLLPKKGADAGQIGGGLAAKEHARRRLEEHYTLAEELREMGHLRVVLVRGCTNKGLFLDGTESLLVHAVLDELMTTAAVEMDLTIQTRLRHDIATRELFSAVLGHDLRNPLAGIILASSKLLRRAEPSDELRKDYRRIAANAERMKRLIDDLLDLARTRAHGQGIPIARKPMNLRALCAQTIDEVQLAYPTTTILFDSPDDVPGEWDPDRIGQLVQNFLRNAIDYSPPRSPIDIALRALPHSVQMVVHNLGAPIPPEILPQIFDPFFQGEHGKQLVRHSKGLGLGLFIAKVIAESHDGSIQVTSDPGCGTTFTISLPRAALVPSHA